MKPRFAAGASDRAERTERRRPRGLFLTVGVAVLAVWATALIIVAGQVSDESDAASEKADVPAASPAPVPVAFQAPSRRVVLPAGAEQVDEYPSRFPRSPEGALAAAVALTRYSASLDYQVVNEVLRLYAASTAGAAQAADSAAAAAVSAGRTRLGLPMTGPVPMDASVFAEPFAVHWTAKSADKIVISVLSSVEYRSGEHRSRELVAATTQWVWDADAADWRVTPAASGATPTAAEIGTAEFNELGWTALAERRP